MRTQSQVLVGSPTRRLALVLGALLLAAAVAVAGALLLNARAATSDWPTVRGGANRSGAGGDGPVGAPAVKWRFQLQGIPGNVAVVGDTAYATTDSGTLTAIDVVAGVQRWSFHTDRGALTSPTVADGRVYVSDAQSLVLALDAVTGKQVWASSKTYRIVTPATFGGGAVFLGMDDGGLLALDAKTGAERWNVSLGGGAPSRTAAYADGLVYVSNDAAGVVAVDAATGARVWTLDLAGDIAGTVVVADGVAYAGLGEADRGHLRAADARTGALKWESDAAYQAPAVANGVAYATDNTGLVAALRTSDGKELWHVRLPAEARVPTVAGGVVYVPTIDPGHAYALDAASGGVLWDLGLDGSAQCCLIPAKGLAFVPTISGSIFAIKGDGTALRPAPPTDLAVVTPTTSPSTPPTTNPTAVPSFPPVATLDRTLFSSDPNWLPQQVVPDPSGKLWVSDPFNDRFAIFDANGKFIEFWGKAGDGDGEFNMHRSNTDSGGSVGFARDGTMFVMDMGHRRVQVFDKDRKFVKSWGEFGTSPGEFSEMVNLLMGPNDTIYVLDDVRGVVERFDRDGKVLKTFDAFPNATGGQGSTNGMGIDSAGNLYVGQITPGQVTRFDPDGNVTQVFGSHGGGIGQFGDQPGLMVVDDSDRLYVDQGPNRGDGPAVLVFDKDGAYLGGFGTAGPGGAHIAWPTGMLLLGDKIYVSDVGQMAGGPDQGVRVLSLLPPFGP
jgi:outer membrane protein assembly factor BamB